MSNNLDLLGTDQIDLFTKLQLCVQSGRYMINAIGEIPEESRVILVAAHGTIRNLIENHVFFYKDYQSNGLIGYYNGVPVVRNTRLTKNNLAIAVYSLNPYGENLIKEFAS